MRMWAAVLLRTATAYSSVQRPEKRFQEIGFSLQDDAFMVGPMFFQMLPFAASADMEDALGRYKLMPTRHCVAMLPLVASWSAPGHRCYLVRPRRSVDVLLPV
ncbi:hypothetical protein [Xanthomonas vesicatoria]|uniref:hypothetical protein n=1 Tax=Xanthomonas vesicatoria TaxID=56460 RepID=UPI0012DB1399|nr:hypothetical protein [Xanthomonas vesicatoria]